MSKVTWHLWDQNYWLHLMYIRQMVLHVKGSFRTTSGSGHTREVIVLIIQLVTRTGSIVVTIITHNTLINKITEGAIIK